MNSGEWKTLYGEFRKLKEKYKIPLTREVKWAYLWNIRNLQMNTRRVQDNHELKFLESTPYNTLLDFVEESLSLINILSEKHIILTYTKNSKSNGVCTDKLLSWHLQEHIQRIEMQMSKDDRNLGQLAIDNISQEKNDMLKKAYNRFFAEGDFIPEYKFIKDSLHIEDSHQSAGIQIADYISGSFNSVLKASDYNGYEWGVSMFFKFIYPNLRRDKFGEIQGIGIREVPRDNNARSWIKHQLETLRVKTGNMPSKYSVGVKVAV